MEFSIKRVNALVRKEANDLKKNLNVSIMFLLPVFFPILKSMLNSEQGSESLMLSLTLNLNSCMVVLISMAMLIAEEKEKNTMRTLMFSAVSPMEFLAGKAIITLIISTVINVLVYFILKINIQYLVPYLIIGLILSISMIILGAVVGILSKNQMTTGTISMPVSFPLFILPTLAAKSEIMKKIANFVPTYHSDILIQKTLQGQNLLNEKFHFLALLIWIVAAILVFSYVYKIKRLDD